MKAKSLSVITIIFAFSFMVFGDNDKKTSSNEGKFLPTISISKGNGNSIHVSSVANFDAPICQCPVTYQGKFIVNGKLSVKTGSASLILWSRVDGKFYFSKLPELQFIESSKEISFAIHFDSCQKTADFIVIELIMPKGGEVSITDISHKKQK